MVQVKGRVGSRTPLSSVFVFCFFNFASFSSGSSRSLPVSGYGSQAQGFVKVGMSVGGGLKSVFWPRVP